MPDRLDELLSEGKITQEMYDFCYPTDGMGWIIQYINAEEMKELIADIVNNYSDNKYYYITFEGISDTGRYLQYKCYKA